MTSNPGLTKTREAEGAIAARRFVKPGSTDGQIAQASAATDAILGVLEKLAAADGERCDVILEGIAEIEYGGAVTRGDPLTADADGKAVVAAPGAGTNNRIGGFALVSGVAGDYGEIHLAPGFMQG